MNLLFGVMGNNGIPADEKVVRSTATPVQNDAPAAMLRLTGLKANSLRHSGRLKWTTKRRIIC